MFKSKRLGDAEKRHPATFPRIEYRALVLLSAQLWAFCFPCATFAGPTGGRITGGSGSITNPSSTLTEIHQSSNRLAIDWQQFNVNSNEVVKFIQPSSSSIALNRILDSKSSLILGRVEANGRLFLVNPRGIVFGKGATVNVAGLVASSLDIDPNDFIKGNFAFTNRSGDGVVVNQGTIEAAVGGSVVMLGKVVINDGSIHAPRGKVELVSAGGAVITFDDNDQPGIQITAEQAQKIANQNDAVRNSGTISAEGGYIALNGATTADLFTNAVNNEGVLVANSIRSHNGVIELSGAGTVAQSGAVNTSAVVDINNNATANGGSIHISGNAIRNGGKLMADGQNGGDIEVNASDLILTQNDASISAQGSAGTGGKVELLGNRVGVMDQSRIDASGTSGGGIVHIGGDFHGADPRNAQRTVVDDGVSIFTDAGDSGNGGEVVVWSDDITYFGGKIFARGGTHNGNGGNVETSGKQSLNFTGFVDTSAPHGSMGSLLLDPAIINIINGSGGTDDAQVADGIINASDNSGGTYQISEQALEALTSNVTLTATQSINIANLTDNLLLFSPNGGTVTFNITATSGTAAFTMADTNDEIRVNNGSLVINGSNIPSSGNGGAVNFTLGKLSTTTAGNITITASSSCTASFFSACNGGAVTVNTGTISSAGTVTINGSSLGQSSIFSFGGNSGGDVALTLGNIASSGAVTINAKSAGSNGGFSFLPGSGNTTISLGDVIESGHADIQVTADSTYDATKETINVGGNYLTDGTGGNISFNGNTLNLTGDTLIENAVYATGGTITITITDATPTLNGHQLVRGYNNIYVGDVSGSATAFGDLGVSQAALDALTGPALGLRATNNIVLGNVTVSPAAATSMQFVANRDGSGGGDVSIASGKVLDGNGKNLTLSGANATINGSIVNSSTGTEQITATSAITLGSGASLSSASGNISLGAGTGIAMASDAAISSTTGQLTLLAANNIALGSLSTGNATTSAVTVTSTGGSISNAGATTNISATAAGSRVNLSAVSGISAALSIADLALTNSTSGAVTLTNSHALQIDSFTNTPATAASITTTGAGSDIIIAGNVSSGGNLSFTSSGAFTVNNGFTVNSNAGALSINAADDAAITGLTTTNNTSGAVTVISGGAIIDNGDTNRDITATGASSVVTLQAASGIGAANTLDTSIANLALSNSTSGAVSLTNNRSLQINSLTNTPATAVSITTTGGTSDLTVAGATSSGGALSLSSGRNMTIAGNTSSSGNMALTSGGTFGVTDGFTVNSNAGTLSINSTGSVAITGLTTTNNTSGAVSIISGGAITDNGNTNADITATGASAVVTLQAASGIGAANALDTSIANLALTNSTSGAVNLTNNRSLQINSITNTPATAVSIATTGAGSNMIVAGNIASGSNVALNSSGTFTMTAGFTINPTAGTIAINSTDDAAITGLTTTNNTSGAVSVISGGAITDNGDTNIDITATGASAVVTLQAASGIGAANALDTSIANLALTNSTSGAVNLTNNRSLQINSLTNTPATAASITTTGGTSDLTVAGATSSGGALSLSSGRNMTIGGNVSSGSDIAMTSSGTFTVNNGNTVNSNTGTLTINSAGNAAITGLQSSNNTSSAIKVTSTAGAISDNGDINADITALQPNAVVTLQAASGISTANAIDINVANISVINGTSGDIRLHALGSFTFSAIDNSASANGAVALSSDGNLTANNITTNNGAIILSAFDNVALNTGTALQSNGGNIAITADSNSNGVGAITMNTATINAGSGAITLSAAQDINLNQLTTTNATTSAVSITSTAGKILGTADGIADITATSAGSRVTLNAHNGIDAGSSALELSVNDLSATNTTSGGINIANDRSLQISALTNAPATAVSITTGTASDLTIAGATSSGGALTLLSGRNMTIGGNTSSSGNMALTTTNGGTFTVNASNTVNSNAGALSINSSGDAAITGLISANTTSGAISIISGGAITDNGNTNIDITATQANAIVTLQAANGIGSANALDTSIANVALTNTASNGIALTNNRALQINSVANTPATAVAITTTGAGSNMTIAGNIASGSNIALTSSGTFAMTDGFTINPTAGTIAISSAGNAAITGLTTTNNTGSAISVISGGAITDAGDTNSDISAAQPSAVVTLQAANGIGAANAMDLAIGQLVLSNSSSGAVGIANNRSLQINAFTNTPATAAAVTTTGAGSNLTIAGAVSSGSNLTLISSGAFTVNDGNTVNSNAGTLAINSTGDAAITGLQSNNNTNGAISVISGGAITDNGDSNRDITATGASALVTLQAANGIGSANALDTSIANIALTNTASNGITLTNNRALQINSVANTPASSVAITTTGAGSNMTIAGNIASGSDIALTSSGTFTVNNGSTVNSNTGTLTIDAAGNAAITGLMTTNNTNAAVHLTAGGAITDSGNTNPDITATQPGAIIILQAASGIGTAVNPLDIHGQVTATNGSAGDIALHMLGSYTFGNIDNSASANGAVALSSDGDLTVNNITTNNGAITLGAFDNVILNSGAALQSSGGNISITADTNTNGVGAIAMNTATLNAGSGTIALSAAQDIDLNQLTTTNATSNAISITSTAGKILGTFDGISDISATSAGARVTLLAANGIDAGGNALELSVNDLSATNTTSGGIDITNDRSLQISLLVNTPATSASIATTGATSDLTIAGATSSGGALTLLSGRDMAIGGNISSGGDMALTTNGTFTVNDGSTVNSNAGKLAINSTGDASITGLQSSNNTNGAISVISGGAIIDNGDTNIDIDAAQVNGVVILQAANGIGAANALDTSMANLALTNSTSGAVNLTNNRSLQINSLTNTPATATSITTTGATSDLTVAGAISSGGILSLTSGRDMSIANNVSSADNMTLISGGTFSIADGDTVNSNTGILAINSAGDAAITGLQSSSNANGAITVSSGGVIIDVGNSNTDISATQANATVTLQAANGIATNGNALELSVNGLSATNSANGGIYIADDRTLRISTLSNSASGDINISVTGAGNNLTLAGTLQNNGGNATLSATNTIDLQDVANVNVLSANSAAVNYAQSVSAGSISSTGTANVAGDLTASAGNIDLQAVMLGNGPHVFTTANGGNINLGMVNGSSDLQLNSDKNITLAGAALGMGNFSARSATNGVFTASGDISAFDVLLNQFSVANLHRISASASNSLRVTADTINLFADLSSNGTLTLTGTTQLQNDVLISAMGSGYLVQMAGSVIGNNHALTIAAANNTVCIACTIGASASGLSALDIQGSVKSVLGSTSVSGNATIRADQEIYLNGDTTITGNFALLADENGDGIGLAAQLTGKTLSVGGKLTVQPMALSSISSPAQCASPTRLPQMPSITPPPQPSEPSVPAVITDNDLQTAIMENDIYALASRGATLHNILQIEYLSNNCQNTADKLKARTQCDVDPSMFDFLGTFLIDNQIPHTGNDQ